MKRCPQCNSLYEDGTQFCLNDGKPLIDEAFSLPSDDEEDTIIRHDPITIDFSAPNETPQVIYQTVPIGVEKESKGRNLLYLLVGLLAGGGLVLAAVYLTMNFSRNRSRNTENTAANSALNNANVQITKAVSPTPEQNTATLLNIHEKPNPTANENELNGRVISMNAYVRSAPNANASIVDTLPVDDRLNVSRRLSPNSPWYQVTCEHGVKGWMHGNTIELTGDSF